MSPADDLSLSEGKGSVLERLKLDTDIQPPAESWETWLLDAGQCCLLEPGDLGLDILLGT